AVSTREPQGATVPDVQSSYAGAPRPPESIYSPVVLTRDIEKARGWLRDKARGSERIGLVASSNAQRRKQLESLSPTSPHGVSILRKGGFRPRPWRGSRCNRGRRAVWCDSG